MTIGHGEIECKGGHMIGLLRIWNQRQIIVFKDFYRMVVHDLNDHNDDKDGVFMYSK